jgi:hypothetical protein
MSPCFGERGSEVRRNDDNTGGRSSGGRGGEDWQRGGGGGGSGDWQRGPKGKQRGGGGGGGGGGRGSGDWQRGPKGKGDKGGVEKSSRRNTDRDLGVKEVSSDKARRTWRKDVDVIRRNKNTKDIRKDDRKDRRRRHRGKGRGYYERKCCYSWVEKTCYFEPKPWGWYWSRRDFKHAARRSGYPWLRVGDQCFDYRHDWHLRDYCYCTRERFNSCAWIDVNQNCW